MLTRLSSLLSSRALLEGKSVENPIQGTWASVHEAYIVVVTATTLLLKLDAQVHNWASKGTSLGDQAHLLSWLFSLLRCKMSLILPKRLYGVTPLCCTFASLGYTAFSSVFPLHPYQLNSFYFQKGITPCPQLSST